MAARLAISVCILTCGYFGGVWEASDFERKSIRGDGYGDERRLGLASVARHHSPDSAPHSIVVGLSASKTLERMSGCTPSTFAPNQYTISPSA